MRAPKPLCVAVALAFAAACATNPVTGRRELALMSEQQEIQLGGQAAEQIGGSIGLYPDERVQRYVADIGKRMAVKSERPNLPWSFQVVDDATVNAFALPGGYIFVTRGIMTHLNSEAELAAVLGHEIGHVTARHSVQQISKAQLAQLGLGVGMILSPGLAQWGQVAGVGLQLLFLKHGRDAERQSDELGFKYMVAENYDPREMAGVFTTLRRASESASGGGKLPEWLSTHPDPENRVATSQQRATTVQGDLDRTRAARGEYLAQLDGMIFGENPRQGFFRDALFLHPDLKFQLQFPSGWKTQNSPQAVAGINRAQDAMFQLSLAGKLSPEEAARRFLSQQGIQPGQAASFPLSGMQAVASYFAAQTQQGILEGLVAFVSYEGITYQLLGVSPQGKLAAHDATFKQVIGSFRRLEDQEALNVQPARLALVRLGSDLTLEQFAAQHPSNGTLEELAIINGVQRDGTLKAGSTVKRIVGGTPRKK